VQIIKELLNESNEITFGYNEKTYRKVIALGPACHAGFKKLN